MRKRLAAIPAMALAFGMLGTTAARATDYPTPEPSGGSQDHSMPGMPGMKMPQQGAAPQPGPAQQQDVSRDEAIARARQRPFYFAARLSGRNEVPVAGKPAVGDPDGSATGVIRLQGDRVTFAFDWKGITAPTLGHIHQGVAGVNGDVKVPLFTTAMPDTATAAAGSVTVPDPATADAIRQNPGGFYLNLHSKEFPGGAVRAQLSPLAGPTDVLRLVTGGGLRGFLSGDQEVPVANGPAVGDPDARAVTFIRPAGTQVGYSFAWIGVTPTLGHIHKGAFGTNGPVVVPLFTTPVPSTIFAIAGTATGLDPAVVGQIGQDPRGFYANLHSTEFPGGALRAQLAG
ncbi:MAG TPA: CHRD domain-containing protein [Actinoallomurus sp.]|jgi:hypothetical protein|nr:CHRD domain-containing protein [Actinoallomurus sp.]